VTPIDIRWLLGAQGLYFAATGVWPLVHMPSFLAVTGPKTDLWLVRTVAVLITVIGASLLTAARAPAPGPGIRVLAVGSALGLACVDVIGWATGTISAVYLADAVVEIPLAALLVAARPRR
jgi:hypothetical protein